MKTFKKYKVFSTVFIITFLLMMFIGTFLVKESFFVNILVATIISVFVSVPVFIVEFIIKKFRKPNDKTSVNINTETEITPTPVAENKPKTALEEVAERNSNEHNFSSSCHDAYYYVNGKKIHLYEENDTEEESAEETTIYPEYNSFVSIDFETATKSYSSACSLGLVKVIGQEIVSREYFLIQPPQNKYLKENTALHNISSQTTANVDTFPAVWEKINHYFKDNYIVAHNALFDMSVLKATLNFYNLECPDFWYFDSIPVSSPLCKGLSRKLDERCEHLGIALDAHHNAAADAEACAKLVLCAMERLKIDTAKNIVVRKKLLKHFSDVTLKKEYDFGSKTVHHNKAAREVSETVDMTNVEIDMDFKDKTFVFTGELRYLSREEAYEKVVLGGGSVKDAVSKKVDYLVNADTKSTTKVKKALELQEKGHRIKIISDEQFMQMLESKDAITI